MTDGMTPAKPRSRKVLARSLIIVLAAVLLYFAFRGIDWSELGAQLGRADLRSLVLAWGLMSVGMALRSVRWGILVSARAKPGFPTMFWATMAGYVGNSYLPARAGDVMRSVLLGRYLNVPKSFVMGTTITERVLDTIVVVVLAGAVVSFLPSAPGWLTSSSAGMSVAAFIALVALFVAPRLVRWVEWVVARLPIAASWRESLVTIWREFFTGSLAMRNRADAGLFAILTFVVWSIDTTAVFVIANALGLDLVTPQIALLLIVALALSSVAPSTPGYVGVYQFVAVSVLAPFAIEKTEALALVLLFQAVIYAAVTPWGLIGLWRLGGLAKTKNELSPRDETG
jgi:hypothetical protein